MDIEQFLQYLASHETTREMAEVFAFVHRKDLAAAGKREG